MGMRRLLPAAGLLAFVLIACSDNWADSLGNQSSKLCVPNQTLVCQCGLDKGSQLCRVDQTLTECNCPSKTTTKPGDEKPGTTNKPGTNKNHDEAEPKPSPTARCGDGRVDVGEACDDGNEVDGDGCSTATDSQRGCEPDGSPASGDSCPGQEVILWKGVPVAFGGSTAGYKHDHASWCDEWTTGPDRVYGVTPKADGVVTVDATIASGFKVVIAIRQGACTTAEREPLCEVKDGTPFKGVIPVKKDEPIFIFVEGRETGVAGAFSLELDLR
jgi:cysteine-rich repeat protein